DMATPAGDDLGGFFGGEVAIAVTDAAVLSEMGAGVARPVVPMAAPASAAGAATPESMDAAPAPAGLVVIIRASDPDAAADQARELSAAEAGATMTETTYRGVTIHVAEPQNEFEDGTAFARLDDLLIVSATGADLEPLIDVHAGGEPALADAVPFNRVRQELPGAFLVYGFTNGPAFREALEPALAAAEADLGRAFPMDQASIGLDAYFGFVLTAEDPGFRFDTISAPAEGAALPPTPANFESTLDDRMPSDTLLFFNGYDFGSSVGPGLDSYGAIIGMIAAEDPTFPFPLPEDVTEAGQAGAIYDLAGRFLAFNPRTDLVGQLVDEWAFALSVASPDPEGIDAIFVSGAGDEVRLNDAVTKLAVWVNLLVIGGLASSADGEQALFGDQPVGAHTEEVSGALTQVIEIPVPDMGTSVRLQWGIVDGQLVFGVGDGFGDYVAGPAASLAGSQRYQAVMGELPAEHNGVFYLDLGQLLQLVQPVIEQELATQGAFPANTPGTPEPEFEIPDLSAIQAFAAVSYQRDGLQGSSAILYIQDQ
ncbi:MAG: DUF3352 domain-containing protein, partial [Thermomicrobiales bacterium]